MVKLTKSEIIKMRIKRIEKEIRDTPLHKGTEHHLGRLRAKISKLKEEQESASKKGGGGVGYAVKKQGDATITLVGPPSAGKSTLINKLTNANSKIAPYEFTTLSVVPGMMWHKDAKIQILDVPGIIEGVESGKGRGKEVLSVVRGSDLLIIMCDAEKVEDLEWIKNSLENSGIRINKDRPNVSIEKKLKGGLQIISNIDQDFSKATVVQIAKEYGIVNGEVILKEKLDLDGLIDSFSRSRIYIPAIFVVNKIDLINKKEKFLKDRLLISAQKDIGLDELRDKIWNSLEFVRVYLVRGDEKPSFKNPLIMKKGQKLKDVAEKIGEEFAEEKTRAKIWGAGSKFAGQEVSISKTIQEGMQIRFV